MNIKMVWLKVIPVVVGLVLTSVVPISVLADDDQTGWDGLSPAQIHQIMWESKVAGRLDREFARTLAARESIENTQTNYDVLFYDIFIRVNDTTEVIYGVVTMVARATEAGVGLVQIDFHQNMTIDSIVAPSGSLGYTRSGDVVTVTLDGTYDARQQFELTCHYHGHPVEGGFQAFSFDTRLGKKVISSLSEPYFARTWWPCKDRMDDKADSFDIAIEVDTAFYVGSNGTLDSTIDHGANSHTFYYTVRYSMVTYLFSVAISVYTIWYDEWVYNGGQDTMPIVHAVYPDRYTYSLGTWGITPQAITIFSDAFGQYPFVDEKYGHANFEWGGAMEHQTMSSMTGTDFGFWAPVVVHELSHQWWGDMITCEQWGHIWLNEGWASYSEAVYYLGLQGWTSYHNYMNGMAYAGGGTIYIDDTTDVWNIFSSIVYDKGAWVVHMLRGVVGESLFTAVVNSYYNSPYQHAAATTEDFQGVAENACGMDLDWFFQEWIYGTYRPNYHWSYWTEPSDSGGVDLFLRVEQTQTTDPQVFTMPVDFFFDFDSGPDDTLTLWIDERLKRLHFNFPGAVNNIELDPSDWVLKYETKQPWKLYIITIDDELSSAQQYLAYSDTLQARGGTGFVTWSLTAGALPTGLNMDTAGFISGAPTDSGDFQFTARVDDLYSSYFDEMVYDLRIEPTMAMPADVDLSWSVDVGDLTHLVAYLFQGGLPPVVLNTADVNASCSIDVDDLTYLVAYLFQSGPAPLMGCVL